MVPGIPREEISAHGSHVNPVRSWVLKRTVELPEDGSSLKCDLQALKGALFSVVCTSRLA